MAHAYFLTHRSVSCPTGGRRRLLLGFLEFGGVAGFLNRGDQVVGFRTLLHGDGGFAEGNFGTFDSFGIRKCGPHFCDTVDGSGHPGHRQVDGFLLRGIGGVQ
jgi:hypothetical protein